MGQLLLIALIGSIMTTLLIVPVTRKVRKGELTSKQFNITTFFVFVISFISVFFVIYVSKVDLNWTIFLYVLPVVAIAGAILSIGVEQRIKSAIVFIGIIAIGYLLSAPIWNADDKYNSAEMAKQVEIEPFDESKTPASVPPKFVKNKMKKAFGQVPNTSYYEPGIYKFRRSMGRMYILRR